MIKPPTTNKILSTAKVRVGLIRYREWVYGADGPGPKDTVRQIYILGKGKTATVFMGRVGGQSMHLIAEPQATQLRKTFRTAKKRAKKARKEKT